MQFVLGSRNLCTMNKLMLAVVLLLFSLRIFAAPGRFEIYTGVGRTTFEDILSGWYNPDRMDVSGAESYRHIQPVWLAGVDYHTPGNISLGICIARHSFQQAYFNRAAQRQYYSAYDATSICAEMKGVIYKASWLHVYVGVSAGVFHQKGTETYKEINTLNPKSEVKQYNSNLPAFQVTAAGLRLGRVIGGYLELGFGYKGLINGGLSIMPGRWKGKGGFS